MFKNLTRSVSALAICCVLLGATPLPWVIPVPCFFSCSKLDSAQAGTLVFGDENAAYAREIHTRFDEWTTGGCIDASLQSERIDALAIQPGGIEKPNDEHDEALSVFLR